MAEKENNETAGRHRNMKDQLTDVSDEQMGRVVGEEEGGWAAHGWGGDRLHTYQGKLQRTPCLCLRPTHSSKGRSAAETVSAETGQRSTPSPAVRRPHAGGGANNRSGVEEPRRLQGRHTTHTQTFCDKVKEQSRATHDFPLRVEQ